MTFQTMGKRILASPRAVKWLRPVKCAIKRYWEWRDGDDGTAHLDRMHRLYFNKPINLTNPQTLYDKLCYMLQHTDVTEWARLTDKVAVRQFVRERGLGHILNEVYLVWDYMPSFAEFAASLPGRCVVKTNHTGGSEGVFIIRDKTSTDLKKVYRGLRKSFCDSYGKRTGQQHYKGISPKIIVERLMSNDVCPDAPVQDYKIFCVNGEVDTINIISDRNIKTHRFNRQYYDTDMTLYDWDGQRNTQPVSRPECLDEMIDIARTLAKGFPFVRVDLYQEKGRVVFGEMTFTPGFNHFISGYADSVLKWGERIDLALAVPKTA